jgi:hypothetical protein
MSDWDCSDGLALKTDVGLCLAPIVVRNCRDVDRLHLFGVHLGIWIVLGRVELRVHADLLSPFFLSRS